MNNFLKHPIVATVIGGIILAPIVKWMDSISPLLPTPEQSGWAWLLLLAKAFLLSTALIILGNLTQNLCDDVRKKKVAKKAADAEATKKAELEKQGKKYPFLNPPASGCSGCTTPNLKQLRVEDGYKGRLRSDMNWKFTRSPTSSFQCDPKLRVKNMVWKCADCMKTTSRYWEKYQNEPDTAWRECAEME